MATLFKRRLAAVSVSAALALSGIVFSAPAHASIPPVVGVSAQVTVAPIVTAKAKKKTKPSIRITYRTKSKTSLGKTLTFKGKTSKALKGKRVKLQIKSGKNWRTIKSVKVSSKRTFKVTAKASKGGKQYYRVYAPATKTTKPSKTSSMRFTVWRWYALSGREVTGSRLHDWSDEHKTIGGKSYSSSVVFGWGLGGYNESGWADYNLGYRCTKFSATVGLSDKSHSGAQRSFSILADDLTTSYGVRGIGAGLPVTANVSDVFRLRLISNTNESGPWSMGVFGSAKVYCSQNP